ncbi:MAG: HEPN domain-containing protein [Candidatus Bipolaricaulaceae bacterium]
MNAARTWFEFARTDLRVGELAKADGLYNQACFHAHQAVEKMLKGFLLLRGDRVPRTHSLLELGKMAREHGFPGELLAKVRVLDGYYLPTRYPDALPDVSDVPGPEDAEEALAVAEGVWRWVSAQAGGTQGVGII